MAKVLVGIPVRQRYGQPSYKTSQCLKLVREYTSHAMEIFCAGGQQISQNSVTICNKMIDENWDYLLYTGDDIIFPPWALDRLIAKDKDFVSGVCTWKSPPFMVPVGKEDEDGKFKHILIRPEHVQNEALIEVDGVGSGFILVKRRVFELVRDYMRDNVYPKMTGDLKWFAPLPFFGVTVNAETGEILGSDFHFSKQCRLAGVKIFMDCGLICRHRWEGEFDITTHWDWMERHGGHMEEERFFGDQVPYTPFDENSIYWGKNGPPVNITVTSAGNIYHAQEHVCPVLGCFFEPIMAQGAAKTRDGYLIGWHVSDDETWQIYSSWCARFDHVLIHWVGSDILNIDKWINPDRMAHLNHPRFIHLVEDERLLPEVKRYFGNVEVCSMPTFSAFPVAPIPSAFEVAVYYPEHRHDFHYGDVVEEVIEKMPDVKFNLYHLFGGPPKFKYPNMEWLGNLNRDQYAQMLARSSCMLRLSQHDGRPFSIVEAALMGRRFVTNFDMPFTHRVPDSPTAEDVIEKINEIRKEHEPDKKAAEHYAKENDFKAFKDRIKELMKSAPTAHLGNTPVPQTDHASYNYFEYWNNRWTHKDGGGDPNNAYSASVNDVVRKIVEESGAGSVLDVGCGSMNRWDELLVDPEKYVGVDVSQNAVRMASERFPEATFFTADITKDSLPEKDAVIAVGVLPHLKPEHFKDTLRKLLRSARKIAVFTYTFNAGGGGYQYEVGHPTTWNIGSGWDIEVTDPVAPGTIQVVVCRRKGAAHAGNE